MDPSSKPSRRELANAIRALSMDAVQKANSGHPGMPMGMADIAEVLWNDYLRHNPTNPKWLDRDRFVVSNGHGSMLLYSLLHLTGYDLPIEELKNFRQLHSKTPGHPEYGLTPGVETTTGPLGQGLANAVGMALAERVLAAHFNKPGFEIVNHYTYAFTGDGCLMEGISHEACSLAGTLGLGRLIVFYDDNGISIDGEVAGWFRDDTPGRFEAYGWQVIRDVNGHDAAAVKDAIEEARAQSEKPTLICCKTVIGWGAPNKQGTAATHGAALGDAEVAAARETLGWKHAPFEIPANIREGWDARGRGRQAEAVWTALFTRYKAHYPALAREFTRRMKGELPDNWPAEVDGYLQKTQAAAKTLATRKSSKQALDAFVPTLPELFGGSADLSESNCTDFAGHRTIKPGSFDGNYVYYGVREFGMSGILNGIALHGGLIPFGGTFLVFSDYARNALRVASLMKLRSIFVFTHDSVGLGEDGPTHQPIEHLAALRLIPNLSVWRPCDAVESGVAWQAAIERTDGPTALALTRQNSAHQPRTIEQLANIRRGGYVLWEPDTAAEALIMATGSEVQIAVEAAKQLGNQGHAVRVVSMPANKTFDAQGDAYRSKVLPSSITARVAVEAATSEYWWRYVGENGRVIGIDRFGESAPGDAVMKYLGITVEAVVAAVNELLGQRVGVNPKRVQLH